MIPKYAIFLFFALLFLQNTEGVAQCSCTGCRCTDSLELIKLYKSTNGAKWKTQNDNVKVSPWDTLKTMTTWYGITIENGRVTSIDVNNNNLDGIIPNLDLKELKYFSLHTNNLKGSIPTLNFPKLEHLNIGSNKQLTGSIPYFNMPLLKYLHLDNDSLIDTIPKFYMPLLEDLSLANNKLRGKIPDFNFPKLKYLVLHTNDLSESIPDFNNLSSLEILNLDSNRLTGKTPNFSLPSLQRLSLQINLLDSNIPDFNLPNLTLLALRDNKLTGSIPNFNLPKLQVLSLRNNKLSGNLPKLQRLVELRQIYLNNNDLSGCYPPEWQRFCQFKYNANPPSQIDNSYNFTSNPKLAWQGDFQRLCNNDPQVGASCDDGNINTVDDKIQSDCICKGSVISCPKDKEMLIALYKATDGANWNKRNENGKTSPWDLNKPISTWYGIETNSSGCVIKISLDSIGLSGLLPNFKMDSLKVAWLGNNLLKGDIPSFSLPMLESMGLQNNRLSGNIPNLYLPNLKELQLQVNDLRGGLPQSINNLTKLELLWVGRNPKLGGQLPNLSNLTNLKFFAAENDSLSGEIPNWIGNLSNIEEIGLQNNPKLGGKIPLEIGKLKKLKLLWLENTGLTGTIPKELAQLDSLELLTLNNNQLEGSLPYGFSNLKKLLNVIMDNNQLTNIVKDTLLKVGIGRKTYTLPARLRVSNNKLTFTHILPYINLDTIFVFKPQKPFSNDTTIKVAPCGEMAIELTIDRNIPDNKYVWYKNGKSITLDSTHIVIINTGKLTIKSFSEADTGSYVCKVTNARIKPSDLTLESGKFKLEIDENAGLKIDAKEIYNGLTLNGDEENRYFKIKGIESCATNELRVYNKFGVEVYRKSPYDNKWDGKIDENPLPEGTYYYLFYPTKGSKKPLRGNILILR